MFYIIVVGFLTLLISIVYMIIRKNKKIVNQEFIYLINEINKYRISDKLKLEVTSLSNEKKKEYFNIILNYFSNSKINLSKTIIGKIEIVSRGLGYPPDEVSL